MDIKLHKQATITPKIRAEIQAAPSSIMDSKLARQYGVANATIRRWRYLDDVHDRPHTRHILLATLTPEQQEMLVAAREFLRLGLDDLLVVAREFMNPGLLRSGLHRMLKRREVPTLEEPAGQDICDDGKPRHKPFKDYEPGIVHIGIKHLPQMPDEEQKHYLYVAIDHATRWVYLEIKRSQSAKDARAFMQRAEDKAPSRSRRCSPTTENRSPIASRGRASASPAATTLSIRSAKSMVSNTAWSSRESSRRTAWWNGSTPTSATCW